MLGLSPYCTFIAHVPYPRTTPNEGLRRPANFHHVEHRDGKTKMRFKIVCCILGKAHIGKSTWALLANQVHLYICSYIHIFYIQMVRFNSYANLPDGTFCYLSVSSSQWKWLEFMDLMKETSQWPAWKSYKFMKTEAIWRYPWPPMSHISGWFWTVQWWSMTSRSPFSTVPGPRFWAETRWSDLIFDTCLVLQFSYWHKIHKSQTLPNSVDCSSCFLPNSMHICTMQCRLEPSPERSRSWFSTPPETLHLHASKQSRPGPGWFTTLLSHKNHPRKYESHTMCWVEHVEKCWKLEDRLLTEWKHQPEYFASSWPSQIVHDTMWLQLRSESPPSHQRVQPSEWPSQSIPKLLPHVGWIIIACKCLTCRNCLLGPPVRQINGSL